jgi:RNA polymerase sigma-70 factor, ECF subfamily
MLLRDRQVPSASAPCGTADSEPRCQRSTLTVALGPYEKQAALNDAMDRYVHGQNKAFRTIYELLAPRMTTWLRTRGCSVTLAEDLLQQAFFRIHRARDRYEPGRDVTPWVFAITLRLFADHQRRSHAQKRCAPGLVSTSGSVDPESYAIAAEAAARLERELANLPVAQRRAFELVRLRGLSMAQAAKSLGTTTTGVKLRLHRAQGTLRGATSGDHSVVV